MTEHALGDRVVAQVGVVVRDIEAAIERYSRILGKEKPPIIITDEVDKARTLYRGKSTPGRCKLAFFDLGQVQLELLEPFGGPSAWQEVLDQKGEGVHHLAFWVKDTEGAVKYLGGQGIPEVQHGYFEGGMYTYVDSQPQLGVMLELLQRFS
jgi:catechol 2,3-dioxygenase-like lactoylglutathione lyase family enzyme